MEFVCGCCQGSLEMPACGFGPVCLSCFSPEKVSPQTDFFQYVNHDWLNDETITIPEEYPRWGSFIKLVDEALKAQIAVLQELVTKSASVDEEKLACVWRASMARFQAWEAGKGDCSEIVRELKTLNEHIPSLDDGDAYVLGLSKYMSRCQEVGITVPLAFGKEANLKDTENIVLDLSPNGMSLPSRDYYLDSKFEEQRKWFKEHLVKLVDIIGAEHLERDFVDRVIRLETKIAQIQMKPDQSRQFDQYFTVTTLDELLTGVNNLNHLKEKESNYPENQVDDADGDKDVLTSAEWTVGESDMALAVTFWEEMFKDMHLREVMIASYAKNYPDRTDATEAQFRMMCFDGDYFRRILCLLLRRANRQDVKAYLQYQIISSASNYCTKALNDEFFDFYSRKLGGQQQQKTPEKRTMNLVNSWLGELMGKIYVSRFFSKDDKNSVHAMVKDVLEIMEHSLKTNDWLTEETKAKAKKKLDKFVVKLGYPDKWKNYDSLVITKDDSLFSMAQKVKAFEHQKEFIEKINTVKDKTKWEMNPQDVNAYFHPLNNEIVFPAAIMQPPFYQRAIDTIDFDLGAVRKETPELLTAINFGGIGAVIAHEITHGYDDQGKKFDHDGNINDWWTEEDAKLFKGKCALMAEQASQWTFEDKSEEGESKVHTMNGELTMGENLADLGGMSLACQALQKRLGSACTKDHLTAFFMSWASIWKSKETKAFIIKALATDPHAPCSFRGNLVKNVDAFMETFEIQPGAPMYLAPEKRVKMW